MQKEEFSNENFLPKVKLYSESEAAQFLGVSRVTLIRLRERQAIGHFRIAARVLYSEKHLSEFLAEVERKPRTRQRKS